MEKIQNKNGVIEIQRISDITFTLGSMEFDILKKYRMNFAYSELVIPSFLFSLLVLRMGLEKCFLDHNSYLSAMGKMVLMY